MKKKLFSLGFVVVLALSYGIVALADTSTLQQEGATDTREVYGMYHPIADAYCHT